MRKQVNYLYEFDQFRFAPEERLLLRDGKPVPLSLKTCEILHVLIRNPGHVVEKDELMREVWPDTFVEESNLTQNISVLRRALGESARRPRYIETVHGRGYRFIAPVREITEAGEGLITPKESAITSVESESATRTTTSACAKALAVLPFVNASDDPNMDYLSDGITESLINALAQLNKLRVMARSTVFRYKGAEVEASAVGRELNVQMALIGRVLKIGRRLVISAELVNTSDGTQVWGGQFNRQVSDIFSVQEEISEEIVRGLRLKLSGAERRRLTKRHTDNVRAYNLYLRGCYFWNKYNEEGVKRSVHYFRRAIKAEPKYALAHAGLADAYYRLSNAWMPPSEALPLAQAAALEAVRLDDTLPHGHCSLGLIKMFWEHDWAGAGTAYRRAIELNPGASVAHQRYGTYLIYLGRFEEALKENRLSLELDPLSLQANVALALNLYVMGRHDEAIIEAQKVLQLDPNYLPALHTLGCVYTREKKFPEAVAQFERAIGLASDLHIPLGFLGHAYAVSGMDREAEKVIADLKELSERRYVSPYSIAVIYAGLGDYDAAMEWLERVYEERSDWLVWLGVAPELEPLRADGRFTDLLRRVGFPNDREPQVEYGLSYNWPDSVASQQVH
jgi:TolB-like protein/tetratricopeptide (TPR) repeat protein